jgi:hypothetical protein
MNDMSPRMAAIIVDALGADFRRLRIAYRADPEVFPELLKIAELAFAYKTGAVSCGYAKRLDTGDSVRDNSRMSVREAAVHAAITPQAIRYAIKSGRLVADKIAGIWLIDAQELARFAEARKERKG